MTGRVAAALALALLTVCRDTPAAPEEEKPVTEFMGKPFPQVFVLSECTVVVTLEPPCHYANYGTSAQHAFLDSARVVVHSATSATWAIGVSTATTRYDTATVAIVIDTAIHMTAPVNGVARAIDLRKQPGDSTLRWIALGLSSSMSVTFSRQ